MMSTSDTYVHWVGVFHVLLCSESLILPLSAGLMATERHTWSFEAIFWYSVSFRSNDPWWTHPICSFCSTSWCKMSSSLRRRSLITLICVISVIPVFLLYWKISSLTGTVSKLFWIHLICKSGGIDLQRSQLRLWSHFFILLRFNTPLLLIRWIRPVFFKKKIKRIFSRDVFVFLILEPTFYF